MYTQIFVEFCCLVERLCVLSVFCTGLFLPYRDKHRINNTLLICLVDSALGIQMSADFRLVNISYWADCNKELNRHSCSPGDESHHLGDLLTFQLAPPFDLWMKWLNNYWMGCPDVWSRSWGSPQYQWSSVSTCPCILHYWPPHACRTKVSHRSLQPNEAAGCSPQPGSAVGIFSWREFLVLAQIGFLGFLCNFVGS